MITEIGALVGIMKTLLEATKAGMELFGAGARKRSAESVSKAQERLGGVAEQLFQSVALSKMLPIWLQEHSKFDLYTDKLSDDNVKLLDSGLKRLISDSIHDHFSATFFRTSFAVLPNVETGIQGFRQRLVALETQLEGITAGNADSWRLAWPTLKVRLNDLRIEATKLDSMADELHAKLVTELRETAKLPSISKARTSLWKALFGDKE
jgi:hypothetical protein